MPAFYKGIEAFDRFQASEHSSYTAAERSQDWIFSAEGTPDVELDAGSWVKSRSRERCKTRSRRSGLPTRICSAGRAVSGIWEDAMRPLVSLVIVALALTSACQAPAQDDGVYQYFFCYELCFFLFF